MPSNITVGVAGVAKCNSANALNRNVRKAISGGTNAAFDGIAQGRPDTMDGDNTIDYTLNTIAPPNGTATLGAADTVELGGNEISLGRNIASPLGGNNIKVSDVQLVDTNFPVKYDINGKSVNTSNITATTISFDISRSSGAGDSASKYGRSAGYRMVYKNPTQVITRVGTTITQ